MSTPGHPARWQQPTLPDIAPVLYEPLDPDDPGEGLMWIIDDGDEYLVEIDPLDPDPPTVDGDGVTS